jgi:hypothetical protein
MSGKLELQAGFFGRTPYCRTRMRRGHFYPDGVDIASPDSLREEAIAERSLTSRGRCSEDDAIENSGEILVVVRVG